MVRGYILGYGVGIPDVYKQDMDAKQRYHTIKNLSKWTFCLQEQDLRQPLQASTYLIISCGRDQEIILITKRVGVCK